jgi:PAS domain S-box-containing protein
MDITARKEAEERAAESEGRFLMMANSTPVIMWASGLDKQCTFCNQAWLNFTGRLLEGQSGFGWAESLHPEDRAGFTKIYSEAFDARQPFYEEYRVRRHDGQYRWISAHGTPRYDEQQNFLGYMGSCVDVTDRKEAEDRARESEEKARESEGKFLVMANSAPVLIWASGTDKLCTFFNKAWLDFTGRKLEQELGDGWAEGLHPEDAAGCVKTYVESFDARLPFTMEYRLRRHDGHYRWVSDHGVPRYDAEQNFVGYIGSCIDVTEQRCAEEEAARSREELAHVSRVSTLGELAGSLAHELYQPLSAIIANVEVVQLLMGGEVKSDKEVGEVLTDIGKQGQRAGEIIEGIRGMLKKEPEQMAGQDLNVAVKNVLDMVRHDLTKRGVRPVLQLDPELPPVNGYGVQLRQVILNLVMNACEAMADTRAGGRELTIESKCVAAAEEVEVSVADTGSGFPEEILRHVFEPFRTTKPKGLGLGLAICRSIIDKHGGRLVAMNNRDRGATVRFTLPVQNGTGI